MMKSVLPLLVMALASCVYADGTLHYSGGPTSAAPAPAPSPASSPAQAQISNPAAPTTAYGESQSNPQVDQQGYYYYYYPVQEQQKTKGIFDFSKDSNLINAIIIGVLFVGGLLVALSYLGLPTESRTLGSLGVNYHDLYDLATKVYTAVSKKY